MRLGITTSPRWTHLHAVDTAPTLPRQTPHRPLAGSGRGIPIITGLAAMTWIDQAEQDKTIHVVLTRTDVELTAQERRDLHPRSGVDDTLLRPGEVAAIFGVRAPTIARWAREGKLTPTFTPGGHRRYRLAHIRTLLTPKNGSDPVMVADAVHLYDQGWSIRQVAAGFECGYGVMRRILDGPSAPEAVGHAPDSQEREF